MTRKRGKSRLSSSFKRASRFKLKYTASAVSKRFKKLLPVMYPQMEIALIDWDFLEYLVFPRLEALGVPEDLWPYYMAWVKAKAHKGLIFSYTTLDEENRILKEEFVTRGLDSDILDAVEPFIDDWYKYLKKRGTFARIIEWVEIQQNLAQASNSITESVNIEKNDIRGVATISESVVVTQV